MVTEDSLEVSPPVTAGVKSVAKAARILRTFEPGRRALTVRDIAGRTDLPRSTCHALCTTLVAANLLEQLPTGGYRLADSLVEMGGQVIERVGLVEAATPSMIALGRATGGEVHLGQLVGSWIVYLTRIGHERGIHMHNRLGLRAPLHQTGCGRAVLSRLDPQRARPLISDHEQDEDKVERLMADLVIARRRGFAVSDAFQPGVASIAAPLFAPDGTVVGAMSVAQRREGLRHVANMRLGAEVVRAAAETSNRLRWRD